MGAFSLPFPHECFIYWRENDCSLQWGQRVGLSKTNCSRTSKWQSMITHCKESKWLPMEWIGGQRIMAEHRWKIDVWLGVITPLGGSLLIYHTNSKCFYSDEGVTGRNDCYWTEEEPRRLPPITTHAIECLLMDKCAPCQRSIPLAIQPK